MRWPRGYVGTDHETLGSSLLSLFQICPFPDQVLGADNVGRLEKVDPRGWYGVDWFLALMDRLERFAGSDGLLHLGRKRFELSHDKRVACSSARDVIYGIEEMYRHANRGQAIGGWQVLEFVPGFSVLEKTTPYHCSMEQGILLAGLDAVDCPVEIEQRQCFRAGADSCVYAIRALVPDSPWGN
jgi:hypothetical protein